MNPVTTPPVAETATAAAARAVNRAANVARVSSLTLLVLGGISSALSILSPLSASFAISLAVFANGWIERHFGRRLAARDPGAPRGLAVNQAALGLEVAAYAAWQAHAIGPDQIDAALQRPLVARVIGAIPPELAHDIVARLPGAIGALYLVVGGGAFLGCAATAWYYGSRARWVRACVAPPVPPSP